MRPLSLLLLTLALWMGCAKDQIELVPTSELPLVVLDRSVLQQPTVVNGQFWVLNQTADGLFYSAFEPDGSLVAEMPLAPFFSDANIDALNGGDLVLRSSGVHASYSRDSTIDDQNFLYFRHALLGLTGVPQWTYEGYLPTADTNYVYLGAAAKSDTTVLAFFENVRGPGTVSRMLFLGFDRAGYPADTIYSTGFQAQGAIFQRSAQGNFYLLAANLSAGGGPLAQFYLRKFSPRGRLLASFPLSERLSNCRSIYEVSDGILMVCELLDADFEPRTTLLRYDASGNRLFALEAPTDQGIFQANYPMITDNKVVFMGALSPEAWRTTADYYDYTSAQLAWWEIAADGTNSLRTLPAEVPTVGLAAMPLDDGRWSVLIAKKSLSLYNQLQFLKIDPNAVD